MLNYDPNYTPQIGDKVRIVEVSPLDAHYVAHELIVGQVRIIKAPDEMMGCEPVSRGHGWWGLYLKPPQEKVFYDARCFYAVRVVKVD